MERVKEEPANSEQGVHHTNKCKQTNACLQHTRLRASPLLPECCWQDGWVLEEGMASKERQDVLLQRSFEVGAFPPSSSPPGESRATALPSPGAEA